MNAWHRRIAAFALATCSCGAFAHSPIQGMSHFSNGMLHPALVPAHLIALIATGLWIGYWPKDSNTYFGFIGAALLGLVLGPFFTLPAAEQLILMLATIVAIAVALHWPGPAWVRLSVAACLGVLVGLDSTPDGLAGSQLWMSLAGTWLTILLAIGALFVLCEIASRPWQRIALRVVASWMAASALIVVALITVKPIQNATSSRTAAVMPR